MHVYKCMQLPNKHPAEEDEDDNEAKEEEQEEDRGEEDDNDDEQDLNMEEDDDEGVEEEPEDDNVSEEEEDDELVGDDDDFETDSCKTVKSKHVAIKPSRPPLVPINYHVTKLRKLFAIKCPKTPSKRQYQGPPLQQEPCSDAFDY